jgi:hypothetical protein
MNPIWHKLTGYSNKQVICNYYQDGALISKDGIRFEQIALIDGSLVFCAKGVVNLRIYVDEYSDIEQLSDFSNHYALMNATDRLELYFV